MLQSSSKVKVNAIKITGKHFLRNHNLSISNFCKNFKYCQLESIKVELKKNFSFKEKDIVKAKFTR